MVAQKRDLPWSRGTRVEVLVMVAQLRDLMIELWSMFDLAVFASAGLSFGGLRSERVCSLLLWSEILDCRRVCCVETCLSG